MPSASTRDDREHQSKKSMRRREVARRVADFFIATGVADAPLRDLAAELGISDRMLLYYFRDKAELVEAALAEVIARFDALSPASPQPGRRAPDAVLRTALHLLTVEAIAPYMKVWADILARGGRSEIPFKEVSRRLVESALTSLEAQLDVEDPAERRRVAVGILSILEGMWLLEVAAPGSTQGAADVVSVGRRG